MCITPGRCCVMLFFSNYLTVSQRWSRSARAHATSAPATTCSADGSGKMNGIQLHICELCIDDTIVRHLSVIVVIVSFCCLLFSVSERWSRSACTHASAVPRLGCTAGSSGKTNKCQHNNGVVWTIFISNFNRSVARFKVFCKSSFLEDAHPN